tara:strand:- start:869 stop:2662 length:1794 start_codon:yes stop_codon:yes gene_type:complete
MRFSNLALSTLRENPVDAEIISHQLLVRAGFIRRVTSGIYAYMPLMLRVIRKISSIVENEMDECNCLQTLLPQLHPSEIWEKSGRWEGYTAGEGIMFHLKDRKGKYLGLGPTHEEVITAILSEMRCSYKQLPLTFYQIQTKFRDEIRPRFGLMRSREFIMKDAYSFHSNKEDLKIKYEEMNIAYKNIFKKCGLEAFGVDADSGAIGGASSQEFMVTAESGEDLILISTDGLYSANQEKAISIAPPAVPLEKGEICVINTPEQKTINDLCSKNDFHPTQIVKVLAYIAKLDNNKKQPVLVSLRGDQEVNEIKLFNVLSKEINERILSINLITNEQALEEGISSFPVGAIGPDIKEDSLKDAKYLEKRFIRLADETAFQLVYFICGANKIDLHRKHVKWETLNCSQIVCDIRKAKQGDICLHDSSQKLVAKRGIEVGHIFQLGNKYSTKLNATFTNINGVQEPLQMGCYGIGITRIAQAAVEQSNDKDGIIWPLSIAPFHIIIIIANINNEPQKTLGEHLYKRLQEKDFEVLLDDRDERAGSKFKDSELIGIPWRITVGRDTEKGLVEIFERSTKNKESLSPEAAISRLSYEIQKENGN